MSEMNVLNSVLLGIGSEPNVRLFRNNTGTGWTGDKMIRTGPGLLLTNPRPLHAGLCKGSSDLIGWQTVIITPEMVGSRIAVFMALEVKAPKGKGPTPEQQTFLGNVKAAGGMSGVVRSVEDAKKFVC